MIELFTHGAEYIPRIAAERSGPLLREYFRVRAAHWPHPYQCNECFTIGTFGDLNLEAPTAFALIPTAAEIVLEQTDQELVETAMSLLVHLVRKSNTTEIPPSLHARWDELHAHVLPRSSSDWDAICDWYRRHEAVD